MRSVLLSAVWKNIEGRDKRKILNGSHYYHCVWQREVSVEAIFDFLTHLIPMHLNWGKKLKRIMEGRQIVYVSKKFHLDRRLA